MDIYKRLFIDNSIISSEFNILQSTSKGKAPIFYESKANTDFVIMRYKDANAPNGSYAYIVIDADAISVFASRRSYTTKISYNYPVETLTNGKSYRMPAISGSRFSPKDTLQKITNKIDVYRNNSKKSSEYVIHHLGHTFDNRAKSLIILSRATHKVAHGDEANAIPPINRKNDFLYITCVNSGNSSNVNDLKNLINDMTNNPNYLVSPPKIANEISLYAQGIIV